jgi:hypothetical protein
MDGTQPVVSTAAAMRTGIIFIGISTLMLATGTGAVVRKT